MSAAGPAILLAAAGSLEGLDLARSASDVDRSRRSNKKTDPADAVEATIKRKLAEPQTTSSAGSSFVEKYQAGELWHSGEVARSADDVLPRGPDDLAVQNVDDEAAVGPAALALGGGGHSDSPSTIRKNMMNKGRTVSSEKQKVEVEQETSSASWCSENAIAEVIPFLSASLWEQYVQADEGHGALVLSEPFIGKNAEVGLVGAVVRGVRHAFAQVSVRVGIVAPSSSSGDEQSRDHAVRDNESDNKTSKSAAVKQCGNKKSTNSTSTSDAPEEDMFHHEIQLPEPRNPDADVLIIGLTSELAMRVPQVFFGGSEENKQVMVGDPADVSPSGTKSNTKANPPPVHLPEKSSGTSTWASWFGSSFGFSNSKNDSTALDFYRKPPQITPLDICFLPFSAVAGRAVEQAATTANASQASASQKEKNKNNKCNASAGTSNPNHCNKSRTMIFLSNPTSSGAAFLYFEISRTIDIKRALAPVCNDILLHQSSIGKDAKEEQEGGKTYNEMWFQKDDGGCTSSNDEKNLFASCGDRKTRPPQIPLALDQLARKCYLKSNYPTEQEQKQVQELFEYLLSQVSEAAVLEKLQDQQPVALDGTSMGKNVEKNNQKKTPPTSEQQPARPNVLTWGALFHPTAVDFKTAKVRIASVVSMKIRPARTTSTGGISPKLQHQPFEALFLRPSQLQPPPGAPANAKVVEVVCLKFPSKESVEVFLDHEYVSVMEYVYPRERTTRTNSKEGGDVVLSKVDGFQRLGILLLMFHQGILQIFTDAEHE
ncbi:unnamed protein product [Amoebophrya sp. A120]|nr:unnamed protein product [Amoebophrya sp. A120]|eukprot:GSA120T00018148001.1